jgi:hypothetical protein
MHRMPIDLDDLRGKRQRLLDARRVGAPLAIVELRRRPTRSTRLAWPWVMGAAVAVVLVGIALHRLRTPDPQRHRRALMDGDASDPFKRWVQSVFLIVTRDCDYAHLGRAEARSMLREWWEIHGPRTFDDALAGLTNPGRPDNAWDLVRFIVLARLGVAADYVTDDESWASIRPVASRLQHAYADWRPMARAYVAARRQWRGLALDGSEDDDEMAGIVENIARLHDSRWRSLRFRTDLELDHGRG